MTRAKVGVTDILTTNPDLAHRLVDVSQGLDWTENSHAYLEWWCEGTEARPHEYLTFESIIRSRRDSLRRGHGCSVCSDKKVLAGFNDLASVRPDLASELLHQEDGLAVTASSGKKLVWVCRSYGHTYEATPHKRSRSHKPTGCPYCAGVKLLIGFNDLATTHPALAEEAQFDATLVMGGGRAVVAWMCSDYGHSYEMPLHKRTGTKPQGCPYCANRRVLTGFNDLATLYPLIAAEALFDATSVVAGTNMRLPWRCNECSHEWKASVNSRTSQGVGCSKCAKHGFDSSKPAWLYLIPGSLSQTALRQYGITNTPARRMANHKLAGFCPDEGQWLYAQSGSVIQSLERKIKRRLRARGVANAKAKGFRFSGYTEAFDYEELRIDSMVGLLSYLGITVPDGVRLVEAPI